MNSDQLPRLSANHLIRVARSCAVLLAVVLAVYPLFAWYGYHRAATTGIWAATIAAGLSASGALIALLLAGLATQQQAVAATLGGMLVRMGLPLVGGILLSRNGGPLAEAGVFPMILGYYLLTLIAETLLSLRFVTANPATATEMSGADKVSKAT